jgi:hypothetical protein
LYGIAGSESEERRNREQKEEDGKKITDEAK